MLVPIRGTTGLATVLGKLKDTGAPKLDFGKQVTAASSYETCIQGVGLKISGVHSWLEQYWQLAQASTAEADGWYLCLGPMQRAMPRPDTLRLDPAVHPVGLRWRTLCLEVAPERRAAGGGEPSSAPAPKRSRRGR